MIVYRWYRLGWNETEVGIRLETQSWIGRLVFGRIGGWRWRRRLARYERLKAMGIDPGSGWLFYPKDIRRATAWTGPTSSS